MTKQELIEGLKGKLDIKNKEAVAILETFSGLLIEGIQKDGEAVIPGIGKFKVVDVAARSGVSAFDGKAWSSPAGKRVKFSVSKAGKELV